jgi:tetratricopeptide (TPR) repeat protein
MSEITKGTRVDLGDDLLETRTISRDGKADEGKDPDRAVERAAAESATPESIDELLLNAKILMSEGLYEDAKKTLRRVLRTDPASLSARDRLEEIQKIEIRKLIGQDDGVTGGGYIRSRKKKVESPLDDGDQVAAALEREIGAVAPNEERFFANESDRTAFFRNLELLCAGASARDRIDLGIAFMEMEFFEVALALFRTAAAAAPDEGRARALLAAAWIAKGNGFEAMIELEALIADQSSPPEEKVDFGYLAGRAQELLENFDQAVRWYRSVLQIEAGYRDAENRLRRCLKMGSARRAERKPT